MVVDVGLRPPRQLLAAAGGPRRPLPGVAGEGREAERLRPPQATRDHQRCRGGAFDLLPAPVEADAHAQLALADLGDTPGVVAPTGVELGRDALDIVPTAVPGEQDLELRNG